MGLWAYLLCFTFLSLTTANLEGPFLFFGPKSLEKYKRSALKYLEQDDLMKIYGEQSIVVFNNQDSVPLSSGAFPRLRKMLEGQTVLVLPQDFLDVHPDYISNETQMLTLQGPWSERDAQMTETFARLQDIYGEGKVLGILGNSVSQVQSEDDWRVKRGAEEAGEEEEEETTTVADRKPARPLLKFALYNTTGTPGKKTLIYSSSWPEVRWPDGSVSVLDTPVGEPTVNPKRVFYNVVVRFADGDTNNKITLEFSFSQQSGWWKARGVEILRGLETSGINLKAPALPNTPSAVLGMAYHCSLPLVYSANDTNATLTFRDIKMQPFMESTEKFSDAFDCIGFTTVPIWSGLMVTFIMGLGLAISICMIMDIKTMDRFESSRNKQLTITVSE